MLKVRAQLEDVTADRNRLKVYCPNTFGAELAALARHDFPADRVRRPHCTSTAVCLLLWAGSLLGVLPALLHAHLFQSGPCAAACTCCWQLCMLGAWLSWSSVFVQNAFIERGVT